MAKPRKSPDQRLDEAKAKLDKVLVEDAAENDARHGHLVSESGNIVGSLERVKMALDRGKKKEAAAVLADLLAAANAEVKELSGANGTDVARFKAVYETLRARLVFLQEAYVAIRAFKVNDADGERAEDLVADIRARRSAVEASIPVSAPAASKAQPAAASPTPKAAAAAAAAPPPEKKLRGRGVETKDGILYVDGSEVKGTDKLTFEGDTGTTETLTVVKVENDEVYFTDGSSEPFTFFQGRRVTLESGGTKKPPEKKIPTIDTEQSSLTALGAKLDPQINQPFWLGDEKHAEEIKVLGVSGTSIVFQQGSETKAVQKKDWDSQVDANGLHASNPEKKTSAIDTTQATLDALGLKKSPQIGADFWFGAPGSAREGKIAGTKGGKIVVKIGRSVTREYSKKEWNDAIDATIHDSEPKKVKTQEQKDNEALDKMGLPLSPKIKEHFFVRIGEDNTNIIKIRLLRLDGDDLVIRQVGGGEQTFTQDEWKTQVQEKTLGRKKADVEVAGKPTAAETEKERKQRELDAKDYKGKPQIDDAFMRTPPKKAPEKKPYRIVIIGLNRDGSKMLTRREDGSVEGFTKGNWTRAVNNGWVKKIETATPKPAGDAGGGSGPDAGGSPDGKKGKRADGGAAAPDTSGDGAPKPDAAGEASGEGKDAKKKEQEKTYVVFRGRRLTKGDVYSAGADGTKRQRYEIVDVDEEKGELHVKSIDSGGIVIAWTEDMWDRFKPQPEKVKAVQVLGRDVRPGQVIGLRTASGEERRLEVVGLNADGHLITRTEDGKLQHWDEKTLASFVAGQLGEGGSFRIVDSPTEQIFEEPKKEATEEKKKVEFFVDKEQKQEVKAGEMIIIRAGDKQATAIIKGIGNGPEGPTITLYNVGTGRESTLSLEQWQTRIASGAIEIERVEPGMHEFKELLNKDAMNELFVSLATGDEVGVARAFKNMFDSWTPAQKAVMEGKVKAAGFKDLASFMRTWKSEMYAKVKEAMTRMANEAMVRHVNRDGGLQVYDRQQELQEKTYGFWDGVQKKMPMIAVSGGAGAVVGGVVALASGPVGLIGAAAVGAASFAKRIFRKREVRKKREAREEQYEAARERQLASFAELEGQFGHERMAAVMAEMLNMHELSGGVTNNVNPRTLQEAAIARLQAGEKERALEYRMEAIGAKVGHGTVTRYPYAFDIHRDKKQGPYEQAPWREAMRGLLGGEAFLDDDNVWKRRAGDLLAIGGGMAVGYGIAMSGGLLGKAAARFGIGAARTGTETYINAGERQDQAKARRLFELSRVISSGKLNKKQREAAAKELDKAEQMGSATYGRLKRVGIATKQAIRGGVMLMAIGGAADGARFAYNEATAPAEVAIDINNPGVIAAENLKFDLQQQFGMLPPDQEIPAEPGAAELEAKVNAAKGLAAPVAERATGFALPEAKASVANVDPVEGNLYNAEGHRLAAKIDMGSGNVDGSEIRAMRRLLEQYGITGDDAKPHILAGLKEFNIKFAGDGGELRQFFTHPGAEMQIAFDAEGNPHFSIAAEEGEVTSFNELKHFSHSKETLPPALAEKHGITRVDGLPQGSTRINGFALGRAEVFGGSESDQSEVFLKTVKGETQLFVQNSNGEVYQFKGSNAKGLLSDLAKPEAVEVQQARAAAVQSEVNAVVQKGEILNSYNRLPKGVTATNRTGVGFSGETAYEYWVGKSSSDNPPVIVRTGSGNVIKTTLSDLQGEHQRVVAPRVAPEQVNADKPLRQSADAFTPQETPQSLKELMARARDEHSTGIAAKEGIPVGESRFGAGKGTAVESKTAAPEPAPVKAGAAAKEAGGKVLEFKKPEKAGSEAAESASKAGEKQYTLGLAKEVLENTKVVGPYMEETKKGLLASLVGKPEESFDVDAVVGGDPVSEDLALVFSEPLSESTPVVISESGHGIKILSGGQETVFHEPRFTFGELNGEPFVRLPNGDQFRLVATQVDRNGNALYGVEDLNGERYMIQAETNLQGFPRNVDIWAQLAA